MGSSTVDRGAPAQVVYEASPIMAEWRNTQALQAILANRYLGTTLLPSSASVSHARAVQRSQARSAREGMPTPVPTSQRVRHTRGRVTWDEFNNPLPAAPTDPRTGAMVEPDLPLPVYVKD